MSVINKNEKQKTGMSQNQVLIYTLFATVWRGGEKGVGNTAKTFGVGWGGITNDIKQRKKSGWGYQRGRVTVHPMKGKCSCTLHINYQELKPCGFREFSVFLYRPH